MVFGANVFIEFFFYDLPEKTNKLTAFCLEIEDCCFKNIIKININKDKEQIKNVTNLLKSIDFAILLGGYPRLPGMERSDLI